MLRPQTPRLKRVVELSNMLSRSSGNSVTLPQSLLLGILLEGNGVAVRALTSMSLNLARLRAEIEAPNHVPDRRLRLSRHLLVQAARHPSPRIINNVRRQRSSGLESPMAPYPGQHFPLDLFAVRETRKHSRPVRLAPTPCAIHSPLSLAILCEAGRPKRPSL